MMKIIEATTRQIKLRVCQDYKTQNVFDTSTHKFYPFWYSTTFYAETTTPTFEKGILGCQYTDHESSFNGKYYYGFMFFLSADEIKFSAVHPRHLDLKIWEYDEMVYGFKDPIVYPECLNNSLLHQVAWYIFGKGTGYSYWLRKFVGKKITVENMFDKYGDTCKLRTFGGTFHIPTFEGHLDCMSGKAKVLKRGEYRNPVKEYSIVQLCEALNDIINPQLTLF